MLSHGVCASSYFALLTPALSENLNSGILNCYDLGFPFAFGVFQDYYLTHEPFIGQPNIAVIGTSAMGVMYLASPIIMGFCQTFGRWARWGPIVGLLVMSLSLALSSFASTTTHLIVSQGVLYGLGGSFCYCPCIMVGFSRPSSFRGQGHRSGLSIRIVQEAVSLRRTPLGHKWLTYAISSIWASGSLTKRGWRMVCS